ncbi:MAG: DUF4935 domain-containing protein [Flavobacterium lindanitolerans]|uniref:PIN domain-containing protein n=1 Tax=Flavobacterium lindanitolerans TaxID=428988 RepID=UPI001A5D6E2F|nr:PIN domain-containing protein [Flavobacterium lindanitolerans]MBL7869264.1 DUF4935 domain-containing protein [Flavobacterium lindanitolerans]
MNIFIDTSIIIQENYLSGIKLRKLATLANQRQINLFFTSIIDNEVSKNITLESEKLVQAEKTFKRQLESKYRIAKILCDLEEMSFVNNSFYNFEKLVQEKFKRFKEFAKITTVHPLPEFNISTIIDDYFQTKPPFDSTNKKNEFPDAISFKIAEDYLKSIKSKGIYLTSDNDFENLTSDTITVKNDISEVLEEVAIGINSEYFESKAHIVKCIESDIELFIPLIANEVELDAFIYHMDIFEKYGIRVSIESQHTKEILIEIFDVFDITKDSIGFKCSGTYITELNYLLSENSNLEVHNRIIEYEKLNVKRDGLVTYEGDFESTIYYEFEFPFQVEKHTIEIDEKKSIKSIKSV